MPIFQAKFVVLTHNWPKLHWDLMLEKEATLRTFRLVAPPNTPGEIAAEPLPDHRTAYLDYEGPVSGNRGHVERWDRGEYTIREETADRLEVELRGGQLQGIATLERAGDAWRFRFVGAGAG